MGTYRVYYCAGDGNIFSADDFDAGDDQDAVVHAMGLGPSRPRIFEVWQGDRLVHRHPREPTARGDRPARLAAIQPA